MLNGLRRSGTPGGEVLSPRKECFCKLAGIRGMPRGPPGHFRSLGLLGSGIPMEVRGDAKEDGPWGVLYQGLLSAGGRMAALRAAGLLRNMRVCRSV